MEMEMKKQEKEEKEEKERMMDLEARKMEMGKKLSKSEKRCIWSIENLDAYTAKREREMRYMERVRKSDGFNLEIVMVEEPPPGLAEAFFSVSSPTEDPCSQYVLYAKLGIHRYNMLQGKNLQFCSMVKYNYLPEGFSTTNFITCVAKDPDSCSLQRFQSGVTDEYYDQKETTVSCFIARPESAVEPVEPVKPVEPVEPVKPVEPMEPLKPVEPDSLPQWPSSENDFKDKSRYYLLKKSEVQKYDWIRLYLEIAFANANSYFISPDLTKLVITRVAVQTGEGQEPRKERFETGNATFYIKYKYFPKKCRFARDRIAIIRRTINKKTGLLSLMFYQYFEDTLL